MSQVKGSYYGRVRRAAYALWRGPVSLSNQDDRNFLAGSCLLRLGMRQRTTMNPQIEARAVYASSDDEEEGDAVLRAIYWDSQTVKRKDRYNLPETAPFTIPARFVQMPMVQARQWIKRFDGLQASLRVFPLPEDDLPICSLRVEVDGVCSAFEIVWQVPPGEPNELTRAWLEVWTEMGSALQTCPQVTGFEESFPRVEVEAEVYDLQAYEPVLTLP